MNADGALCAEVDPERWYPTVGGSTRRAVKVCATCPLIDECLDYALHHEDGLWGVWGGTSERQRRRLRAERGITLPTKGEMTLAKVTARLAWGWDVQMIADDLGVSQYTVWTHAQERTA